MNQRKKIPYFSLLLTLTATLLFLVACTDSNLSTDESNTTSTTESPSEGTSSDEDQDTTDSTVGTVESESTNDASDTTDTSSTSTRILLKNATLLDGNYDYETLDVLITDDVISKIGQDLDESLADTVIDLDGYTLMPGFIDAHVHIATSNEEFSDEAMKAWLSNGVTAVGDLGMLSTLSAEDYIEWLDEENESNVTTYVISAGKYIDVEGGYGAGPIADSFVGTKISTADEAANAVTDSYNMGYTLVKIGLSEDGERLTGEMITAIQERCDELGMTLVAAHISTADQVEELLGYGVLNFAHTPSDTMSDDLIQSLVDAGATMQTTLDDDPSDIMLDNLERFYDAGGTIISSTDLIHSSDFSVDATIPVEEMQPLYELGIDLQDVIATATINAAEFLGISDMQGSISLGNQADLTAIEGDLDDSLEPLEDVDFIMYNGEIIENIDSDSID